MEFKIDEQTLNDLELFNQALDGKSIFSCFNTACSDGGKACMRKMLKSPLTDVNKIRERAEAIRYLGQLPFFLDIRREELSFIEVYLQQEDVPQRSMYRLTSRAVKGWLKPDNDCYLRQRAVPYLGRLIRELGTFMDELSVGKVPEMIRDMQQRVKETLAREGMQYLMSQKKDSFWTRESLDLYFRGRELDGVRVILDTLYMLDSLRSLGTMAKDEGLTFPIFTGSERRVRIEGLYHLFLENPVKNDVLFDDRQHLCFLTGPNMAGKSTCMKAFGVAVYLAHCGLPVPAARMELSVFKGLFTTINLSDNLSLGYSHYYNEVARVKYIVEQVRDLQDVVVVFDELFRGTIVKDAYDASCAVIGGLARLKYGLFMISTHIVEVAEFLKPFPSVCFRFFEIDMTTGEPRYTYCLREGVSDERIGMYILKKAGVVDLIEAL